MIDEQEVVQEQQKQWALFSIPIRNCIASIQNQTITRVSSRKGNITTWVYKCKTDFLTAYNHTFAVYLAGLLNREFDIMAQVMPFLQQIDQQKKQHQKIYGYQMVYRFDNKQNIIVFVIVIIIAHGGIITTLHFLVDYKIVVTELQAIAHGVEISIVIKQVDQHVIYIHIHIKLYKSTQANLTLKQHTNRQDQLDILMFEINMLLTLHLKQYHLYHEFKDCGVKFIQMVRAVMRGYPLFKQYSVQQQ